MPTPDSLNADSASPHPADTGLVRAPCPACGAQMQYSAERQTLACTHCGTTQPLTLTREKLSENPLQLDAAGAAPAHAPSEEKQLFSCHSCGAQTALSYDAVTLTCVFCGSKDVNQDAQKTRLIAPAGVLPFRLPRAEAMACFKKWVGGHWIAPNDLGAGATLDNLRGVYVPFWTFDAQAHTTWRGEAGRHTGTGDKRRTIWTARSGTRDHFYDDHLEVASRFLLAPGREAMCRDVASFALTEAVDYDPRLLLGWEAEVYGVDLPEAAARARRALEAQEREASSRELGGDTQRDLEAKTTLTNLSYKHLLLPLWLCAYVYKGDVYHFLVNGQSGRISGDHPYSVWKIAGLVLLALAALLFYGWLKLQE